MLKRKNLIIEKCINKINLFSIIKLNLPLMYSQTLCNNNFFINLYVYVEDNN